MHYFGKQIKKKKKTASYRPPNSLPFPTQRPQGSLALPPTPASPLPSSAPSPLQWRLPKELSLSWLPAFAPLVPASCHALPLIPACEQLPVAPGPGSEAPHPQGPPGPRQRTSPRPSPTALCLLQRPSGLFCPINKLVKGFPDARPWQGHLVIHPQSLTLASTAPA